MTGSGNRSLLPVQVRLVVVRQRGTGNYPWYSKEATESKITALFNDAYELFKMAGIELIVHSWDEIEDSITDDYFYLDLPNDVRPALPSEEWTYWQQYVNVYFCQWISGTTGDYLGVAMSDNEHFDWGTRAAAINLTYAYPGDIEALGGEHSESFDEEYESRRNLLAHELGHVFGLPHTQATLAQQFADDLSKGIDWLIDEQMQAVESFLPWADDTAAWVNGDEEDTNNIMSYAQDHDDEREFEKFLWSENQIRRMRFTLMAHHSQRHHAERRGDELLLPDFAAAINAAWLG